MTTAEIIKFPGITKHDIDAAEMLNEISVEKPKYAFVICWPENGEMPSYHSNTSDTPVILMRLQEFIHKYYNGDFDDI